MCNTGFSGDGINCNSKHLLSLHYRLSFNKNFFQILMSAQLACTPVQSRLHAVTVKAVSAVVVTWDSREMA